MFTNIQYTLVGDDDGASFISVFVPGRAPMVADSTHPNFGEILRRASEGDASAVDLFDVAEVAGSKFQKLTDRVSAANGRLFFEGDEIRGPLAAQVVRFLKEGIEDWKPLVNFFERVQANPNDHSREMLYTWLDAADFTITSAGMIVGYKGVRKVDDETFASINQGAAEVNGEPQFGSIQQKVGDVVSMPRSAVQHDPSNGCSYGLHVGTYEYASGFAQGALLEVVVDPADVVSVPTDCSAQKMRTARYQIVGMIDAPHTVPVLAEDWEDEDYDPDYDYDEYDEYYDDEDIPF